MCGKKLKLIKTAGQQWKQACIVRLTCYGPNKYTFTTIKPETKQVSILKALLWVKQGLNRTRKVRIPPSPKIGGGRSTHLVISPGRLLHNRLQCQNVTICNASQSCRCMDNNIYEDISFPKRVKRHSKKVGFKCQSQVCIKCLRKELFIYLYIPGYLHIYEELFRKAWSLKLALIIETLLFFVWRLARFGKELFIYIYIYEVIYIAMHHIYIYIYMCDA